MRNAFLDFTPNIPTTACHQSNDVERYSRFIHYLWSIIDDSGCVVSCILPSAVTLLSFHRLTGKLHIPPNYVVEDATAQRKPPEVRSWRFRNQSCVSTRPPSTSTPHWPPCLARR